MRLHNYTLKYFTIALLFIIAIWAILFYAYIVEEVYDNIDDGLRNSKIEIIREIYKNPEILDTTEFGISNFRVTPLPKGEYNLKSVIVTSQEYLEYDDEDQPIRLLTTVFYDAANNPYKLEIKTSMIEEDELSRDLSTALIALYFMLIISVSILNYFLLKKVWKSFYLLLAKLKNYTLGSKDKFLPPKTNIKEFQDLEAEIEKMIQRNEAAFSQQKIFISNASHELQTPLAISINKLELLAEDADITENQLKEISSINSALIRLINLNKSLLMLTKIENNQFLEKENISFNELIKNSVEYSSDLISHRNIKVNIYEEDNLYIEMDKGLAITLTNNLLKNAVIHNYNGGSISLTLTSSYFLIQNTSNESALDVYQVFDRFYRNTTNSQSTGLGLALVKSIINHYPNLSIEYFFDGLQSFKISKLK